MNKQTVKSTLIFFAALITVIGIIYGYEKYLDSQIESLYNVTNYTKAINSEYDNQTKDKGEIILRKSIENDNLLLLGSSELGSPVGQNPINMFPNTTLPDNLTIVGEAYVQSLLDAIKVGNGHFAEAKKLGIVVSLQWFVGEDIDINGFAAHFSELQFYNTISNKSISRDSKLKICDRTEELLREIQGFEDIKVYAWLYAKDNMFADIGLSLLKPYYIFREKVLTIKDKKETYRLLIDVKEQEAEPEVVEIDWEKALAEAEQEGKSSCTNNEFNVVDWYYDKYLREIIDDLKDDSKDEMLASKEMQDYDLFLQVCKENGIEPYIILMSTNGKYYDYLGINKETRQSLYDELERKATAYGFETLKLSDHEYEPYFMVDPMHLGWKGWLYVEQQLSEHFAESPAE